jgi:bifunctional DNase/RNase
VSAEIQAATIAVKVVDVQLDPPGIADAGLVLLQEVPAPQRYLRIIVGRLEATGIARAFHGAPQTRPMTWDLYLETLDLLRTRLLAVTITRVEEGRHFYAEIELEAPGSPDGADKVRYQLDARPSDALALVARRDWVEVRVAAQVLDEVGIAPDVDDEPEGDETDLN